MCKRAVDTYSSALMHVSNCYKTQKMCEEAVETCPFILECVSNCYKTQEMWEKPFLKPFKLKYCLNKYKFKECVKNC